MIWIRSVSAFATIYFCCDAGSALAQQPVPGQITNYSTPGNLHSDHALGCIPSGEMKNIYTPADLYPAIAKCLSADKYRDAVLVYALAAAYRRFDAMRVADRTAQQAVFALQEKYLGPLPDAKNERMRGEIKSEFGDTRQMGLLCARIREIGPPNYHPDYMIQHGMSAFMGVRGNGLVTNFNAKDGWEKTLETYLHCPKPAG